MAYHLALIGGEEFSDRFPDIHAGLPAGRGEQPRVVFLPTPAADDDHIEELLLLGQVALDLDDERQAGEVVGQEQAEQPVPVPQGIAVKGH